MVVRRKAVGRRVKPTTGISRAKKSTSRPIQVKKPRSITVKKAVSNKKVITQVNKLFRSPRKEVKRRRK